MTPEPEDAEPRSRVLPASLTVNGDRERRDRGAAAVEFGLILPIMMLIVFATIDFGRLLNARIELTQAAREGARMAAVGEPKNLVDDRVRLAAGSLDPVSIGWDGPCPDDAPPTATVTVTVSYAFTYVVLPGMSDPTLTSKGVMQCQG